MKMIISIKEYKNHILTEKLLDRALSSTDISELNLDDKVWKYVMAIRSIDPEYGNVFWNPKTKSILISCGDSFDDETNVFVQAFKKVNGIDTVKCSAETRPDEDEIKWLSLSDMLHVAMNKIKDKKIYENKLVPRNLDGRNEKAKQNNLKLLQQEVIEGDLIIHRNWDFKSEDTKVKQINGEVQLIVDLGYIPKWLRNIKIMDNFYCSYCNLTSLKNCPDYVKDVFSCRNNKLTSLEGMPKYVGGDFYCYNNHKQFTIEDIPKDTIIKGKIYFE